MHSRACTRSAARSTSGRAPPPTRSTGLCRPTSPPRRPPTRSESWCWSPPTRKPASRATSTSSRISSVDAGLRVGVRGASSKLGWGMPPAGLDLLLELSRQDRVLEHAAGDLVVRVEPGVRLVSYTHLRAHETVL